MQLGQDGDAPKGADAPLLGAVSAAFECCTGSTAVAVSGGGDSMALLHLCRQVAARTGQTLVALTVDHHLRPESTAEARGVAAYCAKAGVPHHILDWHHDSIAGNVSAAARDARYGLIAQWSAENGITNVFLGHTCDDVAENVLMGLARAAGPDGLAQMRSVFHRTGLIWHRPLLGVSRDQLRSYLRGHQISWVDDPTNTDEAYLRARARKAMAQLADIGITPGSLHRTAVNMTRTTSVLDHYLRQEAALRVTQDHGDLLLQPGPIPLHPDMRRRLLRNMLRWVASASYPPRQSGIDTISTGTTTVGGCVVTQTDGQLRITRELKAVQTITTPTNQLWDHRWRLLGPHAPDLRVRAVGAGLESCPNWRATGQPRRTLLASPAVWRGDTLIAAPLAGYNPEWTAQIVANFHSSLDTH